ncbi:hypothetical protein [Rhizobium sp. LC145]|uniref:hypothetical protein n=1 Tax=Rhizobium sp. LC145 TaxID=1120688 RepID=UPI000B182402|nr:hypothetical protein [Rhizobium sp. LC145]TKT55924.1 hypothetical protein FDR95_16825 [Rhizobiaceae bacterium LC148]
MYAALNTSSALLTLNYRRERKRLRRAATPAAKLAETAIALSHIVMRGITALITIRAYVLSVRPVGGSQESEDYCYSRSDKWHPMALLIIAVFRNHQLL